MPTPVLIAASSARILAAALRRGGQRCITLDHFADEDTRSYAEASINLPPYGMGFEPNRILDLVERLRGSVCGLVYGAGFEHDPALLAELARGMPLIGNPPEVVAAIKEPFGFAALLSRLGLAHPEIRPARPEEAGWLRKRRGGAGGTHIALAEQGKAEAGSFWQRRAAGVPVSALFLADGRHALVLGYSEQWTASCATAPFRYGGCAGPLPLAGKLAAEISAACAAITRAAGLRGLNSLDTLVAGDVFTILEVNPRPGASLDIFDHLPLWRYHRDAVAGRLPRSVPMRRTMRAAAILYTPARLRIPPSAWPAWSADRSPAGTIIERDDPVCTVFAAGVTVSAARANAERRASLLLHRLARREERRIACSSSAACPA